MYFKNPSLLELLDHKGYQRLSKENAFAMDINASPTCKTEELTEQSDPRIKMTDELPIAGYCTVLFQHGLDMHIGCNRDPILSNHRLVSW